MSRGRWVDQDSRASLEPRLSKLRLGWPPPPPDASGGGVWAQEGGVWAQEVLLLVKRNLFGGRGDGSKKYLST